MSRQYGLLIYIEIYTLAVSVAIERIWTTDTTILCCVTVLAFDRSHEPVLRNIRRGALK